MSKEIKNRRENILINETPPEILDKTSLETALSTDGFVKNTDYATGQTGGVIRVSAGNGSAVSSGILVGAVRTAVQYETANTNTFICKGTFENVLFSVFGALIRARIPDEMWATLATGTKCTFNIVKLEDGTYNVNVDTIAP